MMAVKSPLRALIYDTMNEQHISQAELARRVGIAPQTINAFFKSRRPIPFDTLEKICTELKIL